MNATLKKFGDPQTRLRLFDKWVVLLRPQQVTLGSLVMICQEEASAFSQISRDAYLDLHEVTRYIEHTLKSAFSFEKINYLMLMMVDPDVHFHVFPRYSTPKRFGTQEFVDYGWPGPPNLKQFNETSTKVNEAILEHLRHS